MPLSLISSVNNSVINKKRSNGYVLFSNNCSSLTGWTTNGFTVASIGGQTGFNGNGLSFYYIYINTGTTSLKGCNINFNVYLTGGCPDFFFGCTSTGLGQMFRFEQRSQYPNNSGFAPTNSWSSFTVIPVGTVTWTLNTWLPILISISSSGVATCNVNGVGTGLSYTLSTDSGYIGINSDGGGGSIYVNNIVITQFSANSLNNLVTYVPFDAAYNSVGGAWVSGTQYYGNLVTGSVTTLYQGNNNSLSTTIKKWGAGSIYSPLGFAGNYTLYVFPSNTGLSWSLWIYPISQTTSTYGGVFGYAVNESVIGNQHLALRLVGTTGTTTAPYYLNFIVDDTTNPGLKSGGVTINTNSIPANTWTHVAWTISPAANGATNATHKFYINSSLINTTTYNYPQNYSRYYNYLTASHTAAFNTLYMDTFRYYTRTLTQEDINYIYSVADPANIR